MPLRYGVGEPCRVLLHWEGMTRYWVVFALTGFLLGALLAAGLSAAEIPRKSPEFQINMADGSNLLLTSFHGKVVVLEFLLTTCPHCQNTSKILTRLQKEYGPRGVQPLGCAIDPMARMLVGDFVKQHQVSFPIGFGDRDTVTNYLQHPPMLRMLVPQLVFIDKTGTIRAQYDGGSDFMRDEEKNIRALLDQLLNEGTGKKSTNTTSSQARKKAS